MRTPLQGTLAYVAVLSTIVAGVHQVSWWATIAGGCTLALISISNHYIAYSIPREEARIGHTVMYLSSTFNAATISVAAFSLGRLLAYCT